MQESNSGLRRFFIINLSIGILLLVCIISWFSWLEYSYHILNFIEFRTAFPIPAKKALRQYLVAMYRRDCETAYSYLSQDSRTRHSYEEFVDCLETGTTEYDLDLIWKLNRRNNEVRFGIAVLGDPGIWSFRLMQESRKWKIVWEKGRPYFPYPDNFVCGISD